MSSAGKQQPQQQPKATATSPQAKRPATTPSVAAPKQPATTANKQQTTTPATTNNATPPKSRQISPASPTAEHAAQKDLNEFANQIRNILKSKPASKIETVKTTVYMLQKIQNLLDQLQPQQKDCNFSALESELLKMMAGENEIPSLQQATQAGFTASTLEIIPVNVCIVRRTIGLCLASLYSKQNHLVAKCANKIIEILNVLTLKPVANKFSNIGYVVIIVV